MATPLDTPFVPHPDNRVDLQPGDRVWVELPYSEAMMSARLAGAVMLVRIESKSAQVIDWQGDPWGAPYLPSEVGIYGPPYYTYGVREIDR